MNHFFITGLPRSRTSWLANWFTWGTSHCLHDAIRLYPRAADLKDHLESLGADGFEYVGNSDSSLPWIAEAMIETFPRARWLFIERDPEEAAASFQAYMHREPYQGMTDLPTLSQQEAQFRIHETLLQRLMARVHPLRKHVLNFADLDNHDKVLTATRFLTPRLVLSRARWNLLDTLRINPASSKIDLSDTDTSAFSIEPSALSMPSAFH